MRASPGREAGKKALAMNDWWQVSSMNLAHDVVKAIALMKQAKLI
ncbi:hypothetical protein [Nitrospira sp.]